MRPYWMYVCASKRFCWTGGLPPQGGPKPVQPYKVSMSCPVPCGMVQAPPSAPAGAPMISAKAPTTAHQRQSFGPAPANVPPQKRERHRILAGEQPLDHASATPRGDPVKQAPSLPFRQVEIDAVYAKKRNARKGLCRFWPVPPPSE